MIGIEAAPHTTLSPRPPAAQPRVGDGPLHATASTWSASSTSAFGPDTLFGDHVGLHDAFAANLSHRPGARRRRVRRRSPTSTASRTRPSASTTSSAGWSSTTTPTTRSARSSAATPCASSRRCGSDATHRTWSGSRRLARPAPCVADRRGLRARQRRRPASEASGSAAPATTTLTIATTTDVVNYNPLIGNSRSDYWVTNLMYPHLLSIADDGKKTAVAGHRVGLHRPDRRASTRSATT